MIPWRWVHDGCPEINKLVLQGRLADDRELADLDEDEWDRLDPSFLPLETADSVSLFCSWCLRGAFYTVCSLSGWPDESEHAKHRLCGDAFIVELWNLRVRWTTWTIPLRWGRRTQSGRTAFLLPSVQVRCCMLSQEPLDETWLEKSRLYMTERHAGVGAQAHAASAGQVLPQAAWHPPGRRGVSTGSTGFGTPCADAFLFPMLFPCSSVLLFVFFCLELPCFHIDLEDV